MENNTFNVAVLGAGNIGSAVIARLMDLDKGIVGLNVKFTFELALLKNLRILYAISQSL